MEPQKPGLNSPVARGSSNAGTIVTGTLALTALGLAAYLFFERSHASSATDDRAINAGLADIESKVADLDQRLSALEHAPANRAMIPERAAAGTGSATTAHAPTGATPVNTLGVRSTPPRESACCDMIPNPELKGRLGRVLVSFPAGTDKVEARIEIAKAGTTASVKTEYGGLISEMLPGTYDVTINGLKVAGVTVQSGVDTRVRAGVLQLNATGETRFDIFAPGGKSTVSTAYGEKRLGFPAGNLDVEVSGQRESVSIEDGKVTEY